jgi:hypothetical protein
MRVPQWLALSWVSRLLEWLGVIEVEPALVCQRCGREITIAADMTETEVQEVAAAHDRFWHSVTR